MIINLIVSLILLCAGGFWLIWIMRHDLRKLIERPKHHFQNNVQSYDDLCRKSSSNEPGDHE